MTQKAVTDALVAGSISYDNSQSGLAADDVQVAVDEINQRVIDSTSNSQILDKNNLTISGYRISSAKKWVVSADKHYYIPCRYGDTFKLTGGNNNTQYAYVTRNSTPSYNTTIYPSSIYEGKNAPVLEAGGVAIIPVPQDAVGLVINSQVSGADVSPSIIELFTSIKNNIATLEVQIEDVDERAQTEIENIWKITSERYYEPQGLTWANGMVNKNTGAISSSTTIEWTTIYLNDVISINAYMTSSSSQTTGIAFFNSEGTVVGGDSRTTSGRYDIAVPPDTAYMRYQCPKSVTDRHFIFYYEKEGDESAIETFPVPMEVGMLISTTGRNHQQSSDASSDNGYAFSSENGEFNIWRNVGMIEVEGDEYTISSDKGDHGSVFLFDYNRNFINRIGYNIEVGESVTVNTSAAKYIRFTVSKKHADYPTIPYSPITEPKCNISGKFSNGLKIAKLKKQTTSTSAGAADTIVTPVWIENTYSTKESTSQLQDTGEWHIDFGRLALPPTYDPDGEPTRLIIICHGTASRYNPVYNNDGDSRYEYVAGAFNTNSHVTPQHILPEGYALMDMDGIFAIFNEKADSDNVIPYAVKQVANCYQAAYDFVTRNYNIKIDGVLLAGISFGGATALQIITHSNIPVIATALDSPYVCESTLWLWGYAPQWGKSVGIEGIVAGANPPENIDILKDNYGKMLRFSPILGVCHIPKDEFFATTHVEGVGDVSFETSVYYNNGWVKDDKWIKNVVYNWACRMPVPIKIWVSASDANVEPSIAGKMLYNVALNGGSDIEYRVIPGNVHTPSVGSGTTYISNYVTKYGETIASMPLVYAEMIRFFRRYEQ
jgi:hypothetical protein